jgi:hypothetical protein
MCQSKNCKFMISFEFNKQEKKISSKYNNLIVPHDHGYYMCIMASIYFLSGIYALKIDNYIYATGSFGVWLTSVNYWRYPTYGLRRNIDIFWCLFSIAVSLQYSYISIYGQMWRYIMTWSLLLFYPFSWILYIHEYFWMATIVHSMLHVFPNLANAIMYSGL